MSNKNNLHALIKSLSRNEKGYFKKMYAEKGLAKTNRYLELFNLMDAQKEYDESLIVAHCERAGVFKQLPVAKNYLNTMILKSLRSFHSGKSVTIELGERMTNVELLFNRGLYYNANKEVKKVEQLIDDNEAYHRFSELARWKKNLLDIIGDQKQIGELRAEIHEKELASLSKVEEFAEVSNLTFQFLSVYLKLGTVRNAEQQKLYRDVMQSSVLKQDVELHSVGAKFYFHNLMSMYHEAVREFDAFYYHSNQFVLLMEQHSQHIKRNPVTYIICSFNRLLALARIKDKTRFEEALIQYEAIAEEWGTFLPEGLKKDMWIYEFNATSWFHRLAGNFDALKQMGNKIEGRTEAQLLVYPFSMLYSESVYMTAYALFALGDYRLAIQKLNLIVNNTLKEHREDIACYAMILNMMCHYELGNFDYVESSTRSTYRFLLKLKKVYRFEKLLISFFRKMVNAKSFDDLNKPMKAFRSQLIELEKDPFEKIGFEYLDLISWITSRIENRPFQEVELERLKLVRT